MRKTVENILLTLVEDFKDMSWRIEGIVPKSEVTGDPQDDEFWGVVYCKQSGPGISGDDYYGHQFFPLLSGKYLKVWYSC